MKYKLDRAPAGFWLIRETEGDEGAYPASYSKSKAENMIERLNNDSTNLELLRQEWLYENDSIGQSINTFCIALDLQNNMIEFDENILKSRVEKAVFGAIKQNR